MIIRYMNSSVLVLGNMSSQILQYTGPYTALFFGDFLRHNSGSFNMAIFDVDVTTVVQLGEDADGRLSVSAVQCVAQVGSVEVQLHGQFRCRQLIADGEA